MSIWVLGAGINVIGGITANLGQNLMRLGHTRASNVPDCSRTAFIQPPSRWFTSSGSLVLVLGKGLFIGGAILNFVSFAFAAQSLLAALAVVQFIANLGFARLINGERATRRVVLATGVIVVGCILLVAFGNHDSPVLDADDLRHLYTAPAYIGYLVALLTVAAAAACLHAYGRRRFESGSAKWERWVALTFALYAAGLGTQSVVFGKSLALLLRATLQGNSQLGEWYTWLALCLFLGFSIFWVMKSSEAMRRFRAITMCPLLMVMWVLISMLSGMVYFQEYTSFTTLSTAMFVLGCAVLLVGIYLLAIYKFDEQGETLPSSPASSTGAAVESREGSRSGSQDLEAALWAIGQRSDDPLDPGTPCPEDPATPLLVTNPVAAWSGVRVKAPGHGSRPRPDAASPAAAPSPAPLPAWSAGGATHIANPTFDGPLSPGPPSCRPGSWRAATPPPRSPAPPRPRPVLSLHVDCSEVGGGPGAPSPQGSSGRARQGGAGSGPPPSAVLSPILSIFSMPGGPWTMGAPTPKAPPAPAPLPGKASLPHKQSKEVLGGASPTAQASEELQDTILAGRG